MDKRNRLTKSLLWISETTGLSAQAAIHALALEKRGVASSDEEGLEDQPSDDPGPGPLEGD